jgi:hypothetical protein
MTDYFSYKEKTTNPKLKIKDLTLPFSKEAEGFTKNVYFQVSLKSSNHVMLRDEASSI